MKKEKSLKKHTRYVLEFKDEVQMWKLLFLYRDLLVPYSWDHILYVRKREGKNMNERDRMSNWMRFGIRLDHWKEDYYGDGVRVDVLMYAEDFMLIKNQFSHERLCAKTMKWVYKGEL